MNSVGRLEILAHTAYHPNERCSFQGRQKAFVTTSKVTSVGIYSVLGRVAQRIRRLTTNQEIPGSNPGVVAFFLS